MMTTPATLWLLRLLPLGWLILILTIDASSVTEAARTLIARHGMPAGGAGVHAAADAARQALLSAAWDIPDSDAALRLLALLFPSDWLLSRLDAAEALVFLFLARLTSGLRLLGVTVLFWFAALYDGLVCRRVAYLTFTPYRPILAMNAGAAAVLLPVVMLTVLVSPLLQAENWALGVGLIAAGAVNLWARSFHRFGG